MHIRLIKMRSKKSILFHEEAKTKTKMERNGFCVNSPLVRKYFNFATKNYAIKKSSALKTINISFNWFCTALNIKRYGFSYAVVFYFLFFIFFSIFTWGAKFHNSRLKEIQVAAKTYFWSSLGILFRAHQASSERKRCLQQIQ